MIDKLLLENKAADLQAYLEELESMLEEAVEKIIEDHKTLHSIERLFQLVVDGAIDINGHIITRAKLPVPDDYQSTFITLGQQKVLPMDFALKIAPSVGLRNLVVHKYEKENLARMLKDMKQNISDYPEYLKYIERFISKP